jgi:hypothetical protein
MLTLVFADDEAPARGAGRKVGEWLDDDGAVCAWGRSSGKLNWIDWPGLGVFTFSPGSQEVRVWPEANAQHATIVDTFSRALQPIILQALGWQALHASAVVGPAGVLAFCGRKGSGKSTLAFAMHQAGWRQLADDGLVLHFDRNCVNVCPLPFAPRLRPASRAHFAPARDHLPSTLESQLAEIPLSAIFLLRQDAGLVDPRISIVPQARAFSEVLAHAHCFDQEDRAHTRRLVDDYHRLVTRVTVFSLEYPPDLHQLTQLIRAVLDAADGVSDSSSELQPAVFIS